MIYTNFRILTNFRIFLRIDRRAYAQYNGKKEFTRKRDKAMREYTLPPSVPVMTLEKALRRAYPLLPGHVLRETFKRRDVRVNGVKSDKSSTVRGGDVLALYLPETVFHDEIEMLFDDGALLAAVKPQGLPVDVDSDGIGADTLLNRLRKIHPEARLCHRLDAATGGIVLAAADETVYEQALNAFRDHAGLRKRYRALAFGAFEKAYATERAYLIKDAKGATVRVTRKNVPGAKPIETRIRVLSQAVPDLYHVELEPVTGRTHQLRAHLADLGHPLLGDDHYGSREGNRRFPGVPLCLWHETLTITENSPLKAYAGRTFRAVMPDWLGKKEDNHS